MQHPVSHPHTWVVGFGILPSGRSQTKLHTILRVVLLGNRLAVSDDLPCALDIFETNLLVATVFATSSSEQRTLGVRHSGIGACSTHPTRSSKEP